jgi:dihydrofolate reductase
MTGGTHAGEPGKDLVVFGGARIAHSLIRQRLVDE